MGRGGNLGSSFFSTVTVFVTITLQLSRNPVTLTTSIVPEARLHQTPLFSIQPERKYNLADLKVMIYRDCPLIGTTSPDGGEVGISRNMRPGTLIPPAQVRNPAEKLSLLYCPIFVQWPLWRSGTSLLSPPVRRSVIRSEASYLKLASDRNQEIDFRFRERGPQSSDAALNARLPPARTQRSSHAVPSEDLRVQTVPLWREIMKGDHCGRGQVGKSYPDPHQRPRSGLVRER